MNQDDLLKYWTDIQGTANALSDELLSELDASDKEVLALIQKSLAKSSVQQTIQAEYEKMSALAQKIQQARAKVFAKAEKVTFEASKQVAGSVQKPAEKLVGKKLKPLKKKEISQVVDYAPYQGKTVREWFSSFQKSDVDRIVASVKEAYNSNLSVADISKKIRETFNVSKRSAETVARTVINGVANEAKLETFLKNPEVIDGIQFVAMLDGRTTFQCASLDGKIWKCSEKEKIIRPPLHPNCRSTLVPYINTGTDENGNPIEAQRTVPAEDFEAIAKQAHNVNPKNKKSWDELSLSVRKSKIYKAEAEYEKDTGKPAYVRLHAGATFKDFLDKQPESFQRRWLGPERYKLYKEGKITFNQLVKPDTGYIVPVAELKKKYGPDGDEGDQSDGGTSGNTPENTPVSPSPDKTSQNGHKMPSSDKKVKVSTKGKNDAKNEEKPAQNADTGKEEQEKLKAELEKAKKEKEELAKKTKEAEKAALLKAKQEAEEKAKAQADAKAKAEKEAEEAKYQAEQAKKKQRAAEKQIKKAKRKAQKEKRAKEAAQEKATAEAEVRKEMEDELKRLQKELGIKKAQEQAPRPPKESGQNSTSPLHKSTKRDIKEETEKEATAEFPSSPDQVEFVSNLGGSTGAKLVKDKDGNLFVMKKGGSAGSDPAGHLRNECAVDTFYRDCGANVPEFKLYETDEGPVKLSRHIPKAKTLRDWWDKASDKQRDKMKKALRRDFAVDIITGNWDVIGMNADNVLVDQKGKPWRIDNGGAFGYRAQGTKKAPQQWQNGWPDDVWTMIGRGKDIGNNAPSNCPDFMGEFDLLDILNDINDRKWATALQNMPSDERAVVGRRLYEIERLAKRGNDFKENGHTKTYYDGILKHSYLLTKEDIHLDIESKIETGLNSNSPTSFGRFRSSGTTPASKYTSFTDHVHKYMKRNGAFPDFIIDWQKMQGYNSYSVDACKFKVTRLISLGYDISDPIQLEFDLTRDGVYFGRDKTGKLVTNHYNAFTEAVKYYNSISQKELQRDVDTLQQYHAAVQLALEQCDFTGNDHRDREVVLVRTENDKVVTFNKKDVGKKCTHATGINESHSVFTVATVEGGQGTIMRVPYSRITGLYFAERTPGSSACAFLADNENEIDAFTPGLDIYYCGVLSSGTKIENLYGTLPKRKKKRKKKGN